MVNLTDCFVLESVDRKSFMSTIFFQGLLLFHCQEIFCQREGTTDITQYGKRLLKTISTTLAI